MARKEEAKYLVVPHGSASTSSDKISDEDFLISQVLKNLHTDIAAAKSWMIFAKSTFPESFPVLFQCYKMECDDKNLTECAIYLSKLIKKFPNEITLIKELRKIANALCSDSNDFLKEIFEKLSEDVKYDVMLAVTRNAPSLEEHCQLMLLFLKIMPYCRILQHGKDILDTLLSADVRHRMNTPLNLFRKMLVCDALPLILKVPEFHLNFKVAFLLLKKAIEYHISVLFTNPTDQDCAFRKKTVVCDDNPNKIWEPLLELFEIAAVRYKFRYPDMVISNFTEFSLRRLLLRLKRKNKFLLTREMNRHEKMSDYEEAYFGLVITFFYYLYNYGKIIHNEIFTNLVTGPYNYILMEGISFPQADCSQTVSTDFKKTDNGYICVNESDERSHMLIPSFMTAVECYKTLHSHQNLSKDFDSLTTAIKLDTWQVFCEFTVNGLIYAQEHREAIDYLEIMIANASDASHKTKAALQIASCYQFMGDYEVSLKILLDVVINLPLVSTPVPVKASIGKCPERYMHFMGYNNSEIIQYCASMLLKLYKCKNRIDDRTLGYMLILMQYNIVQEYDMLAKCIDFIKRAKSFCFPKFFDYIISVDILEEICYLTTPAGGNINLRILSTQGTQDELKTAFVNQMSRCYDILDNLFIKFFKEEQNFLLLSLHEGM